MTKKTFKSLSDNEIRNIVLKYFYDKNKNATSIIGKKNSSAISIKIIRAELKVSFGLSQSQVISNLHYLLSQRYIETKIIPKSFSTGTGSVMPASTTYYAITAAGIDKIDGPTEFTRNIFSGINISTTGQNIITLGDGNQVNAKFENVGNSLNELKEAIRNHKEITEADKVNYIVDIETLQNQLAKPSPNKSVIQMLWKSFSRLAAVNGLIELYKKADVFIGSLIT